MVDYLKENKVDVFYNSPIVGLLTQNGKIRGVKLKDGQIIARNYVVATGGKSRPETGSTGEGFEWMKAIGHEVEESDPALVPVKIKDEWVKKLSGLSFPNAKVTVLQDGKKQESRTGKILFTHFGLSGPLILNLSKGISELYRYASVELQVDLYPDLDLNKFDKKILEILAMFLNKKIKNSLGTLIPPRMIDAILVLAAVDGEKEVNALTREERLRIVETIKSLPMTVSGFLGVEKAVVTSGGVTLKEIDFKTMQSKVIPNLYLAGDILNFDRPSGGFSLQICWTTGFLAGENASKK